MNNSSRKLNENERMNIVNFTIRDLTKVYSYEVADFCYKRRGALDPPLRPRSGKWKLVACALAAVPRDMIRKEAAIKAKTLVEFQFIRMNSLICY